MQTRAPISRTLITRWLAHYYELTASTITFWPGGDCSWIYFFATDDGQRYVLKITRDGLCSAVMSPDVVKTLNALYYDYGIRQMSQPPLRATNGQYLVTLKDWQAVVIPFIDGQPMNYAALDERHARKLGALLATLHMCKLARNDLPPYEAFTSEIPRRLARILRHITRPTGDATNARDRTIEKLQPHSDTLRKVAGRFALLEQSLRDDDTLSDSFVICHGDPSQDNVIITPDNDVMLIDWDAPIIAPRERDLFPLRHNATVIESYKRIAGDFEWNTRILAYYKLQWELGEIVDYSWRLLYLPQPDEQVTHDLDQLETHLKGIGQ